MLARTGRHPEFCTLLKDVEVANVEKLKVDLYALNGRDRQLALALREADNCGTLLFHAAAGQSVQVFECIREIIENKLNGLDEQLRYVDGNGMNLLAHAINGKSLEVFKTVWALLTEKNYLGKQIERCEALVPSLVQAGKYAEEKLVYVLQDLKDTESIHLDRTQRLILLRQRTTYKTADTHWDATPLAIAAVVCTGTASMFTRIKDEILECSEGGANIREDLLPSTNQDHIEGNALLTPLLGAVLSCEASVFDTVVTATEQFMMRGREQEFVEEVWRQVQTSSDPGEEVVAPLAVNSSQDGANAIIIDVSRSGIVGTIKATIGDEGVTWSYSVQPERLSLSAQVNSRLHRDGVQTRSLIGQEILEELKKIGNNSQESIALILKQFISATLVNPFQTWADLSVEIFWAWQYSPKDRVYLRRLRSKIDNVILELLERLPHTVSTFGAEIAGGDPDLSAGDLVVTTLLGFHVLQKILGPGSSSIVIEEGRSSKGALFWSLQKEAKSIEFVSAPLIVDFVETEFFMGLPNMVSMSWRFKPDEINIPTQLYSYNSGLDNWRTWDIGWWGEDLLSLLQGFIRPSHSADLRASTGVEESKGQSEEVENDLTFQDPQRRDNDDREFITVLPALQFILTGMVGRPGGFHPIPAVRLAFEVLSYVATMLLFWTAVSIDDPRKIPLEEVMLYVFVLGIMIREASEFQQAMHIEGRATKAMFRYFGDRWNFLDMALVVFIVVGFVLRMVAKESSDPSNSSALVPAQVLLAISAPLLFSRILFLVQINSTLGPMVPIIFAMIEELLQFAVLLLVVLVGFAITFWALFDPHVSVLFVDYECPANVSTNSPAFYHPLQGYYGDFFTSVETMFQAMLGSFDFSAFDQYDGCEKTPLSNVGKVLLMIYLVIMAILLLNLLIAVLSTAHSNIYSNVEKEFLHARTMIMTQAGKSVKKGTLPPPLNVITSAVGVIIDTPAMLQCSRPFSKSKTWQIVNGTLGTLFFSFSMGLLALILSSLLWVISTPVLVWDHLQKQERSCFGRSSIRQGLTFELITAIFRVIVWMMASIICTAAMGIVMPILYTLLWLRGVLSIFQWYNWSSTRNMSSTEGGPLGTDCAREMWSDWDKAKNISARCFLKETSQFDIRPFLQRTTGLKLENLLECIEDPFKVKDGNLWEDEGKNQGLTVEHLRQYRGYAHQDLKDEVNRALMLLIRDKNTDDKLQPDTSCPSRIEGTATASLR